MTDGISRDRQRIRQHARTFAGVVTGLMLIASPASSESTQKPAVSQINGSVSGFYAGNYYQTDIFSGSSNSDWTNTGGVAADLFLPLGSRFGLSVSGGGRWWGETNEYDPPIDRLTTDQSAFFIGSDLFWRDPETGFLGLSYGYERRQIEDTFVFLQVVPVPAIRSVRIDTTVDQNQIRLGGGFYLAEIDVLLDGGYERTCSITPQASSFEDCWNGYDFGVAIAGYPGSADRVRLSLGVGGGQPLAGESIGTVAGLASISWQPHFFGNRYVRLNGSAGGGAYVGGGAEPFALVAFSLSIDLPGADNLKQLFREMRI